MPDLRKYWQEIWALEKTLPECVWLISVDNPRRGQVGGCVVEAAGALAAKLLHAKSHRLAEPAESDAHQAREIAAKRDAFDAKRRRQGISVVPIVKRN